MAAARSCGCRCCVSFSLRPSSELEWRNPRRSQPAHVQKARWRNRRALLGSEVLSPPMVRCACVHVVHCVSTCPCVCGRGVAKLTGTQYEFGSREAMAQHAPFSASEGDTGGARALHDQGHGVCTLYRRGKT